MNKADYIKNIEIIVDFAKKIINFQIWFSLLLDYPIQTINIQY
jgi:hypothetical protein